MAGKNALLELTKTRLREFWRERGIVFWVFGFPILMAVGLGLAFRSRPLELPKIAVVTDAKSAEVAALLESERVDATLMDERAARRSLARAKVDVVVEWREGRPTYLLDPMQEGAARARLVADAVLEGAAGRKDVLAARDEAVSEPGSRYIDFLLPGLIGLNLMGSSMWGVGYNLVVARKRRLLRRYAVTPMRRSDFLLSYFFSRSLFVLLEIGFLLAFGAAVFGTRVQGSYAALTAVAFVGAASFAGISLLIGGRVENTESANGWMNFVQLPMWVLSGAFFSYERFPEWLQGPIRLLPLTALVDGLRAIFNDAAGLLSTWPELLVLGAWGAAGFALALKTFRWQ